MSDSLIYLMSYDEWDLSHDERQAIKAIIQERDQLRAENDRLRAALEVYAKQEFYSHHKSTFSDAENDEGEIAREALEVTK